MEKGKPSEQKGRGKDKRAKKGKGKAHRSNFAPALTDCTHTRTHAHTHARTHARTHACRHARSTRNDFLVGLPSDLRLCACRSHIAKYHAHILVHSFAVVPDAHALTGRNYQEWWPYQNIETKHTKNTNNYKPKHIRN